jgi:hypothetical protein
MRAAIAAEARGQRALLDGDAAAAEAPLLEAADLYRESWEAAPPASYGRLIGMLKAAVIARHAAHSARYARGSLDSDPRTPPAFYVVAIAALAEGDDRAAREAAAGMRRGASPAMARAADAIEALAERDERRYAAALRAIVDDFEARDEHLTGVPIADTALMLERLAEARGMTAGVESPLLPR